MRSQLAVPARLTPKVADALRTLYNVKSEKDVRGLLAPLLVVEIGTACRLTTRHP